MSDPMSKDNVHKAIAVMTGLVGAVLALLASLLSMVSVFVDGSTADALLNSAIILFGVGVVFIIVCVWSALKVGKT